MRLGGGFELLQVPMIYNKVKEMACRGDGARYVYTEIHSFPNRIFKQRIRILYDFLIFAFFSIVVCFFLLFWVQVCKAVHRVVGGSGCVIRV